MVVELAGIPLIRHVREDDVGVTKMLRSVHNISVKEKRRIIEQEIPGFEGGYIQDFGREPVEISFEGIVLGGEAIKTLEEIRAKFKAGEPVPFSSDISEVAEVTQVLIEDFRVEDSGGETSRYRYWIVLREYTPPPEDESTPSQDEEAEEEVEDEADDALASKNYIIGKVVDANENPQSDVNVKITFDGGEYTIKTDEEGVYRKDALDPGKYTVTIDAPGYESMKREFEVKLH
jgi:hypothetical protein